MLLDEFLNILAYAIARGLAALPYASGYLHWKKESRQKTNPCEARTALMIAYKWGWKAVQVVRK